MGGLAPNWSCAKIGLELTSGKIFVDHYDRICWAYVTMKYNEYWWNWWNNKGLGERNMERDILTTNTFYPPYYLCFEWSIILFWLFFLSCTVGKFIEWCHQSVLNLFLGHQFPQFKLYVNMNSVIPTAYDDMKVTRVSGVCGEF